MNAPNDGGPAFPGPYQGDCANRGPEGMTLRDWFAGQAKISSHLIEEVLRANGENPSNVTLARLFEVRADLKYKEADAMLVAREKTGGAS